MYPGTGRRKEFEQVDCLKWYSLCLRRAELRIADTSAGYPFSACVSATAGIPTGIWHGQRLALSADRVPHTAARRRRPGRVN